MLQCFFVGMKTPVLCTVMSLATTASAQTVTVHLDAPKQVVLEEDGYHKWSVVCRSPCDRELDVRGIYRVGGSDVTHTRVDITPRTGQNALTMSVEPGSRAAHILGVVLTPVGGGVAISGLFCQFFNGDAKTVGIGLNIGGAITGFVGLILLAASKTTITF